jgi:hypothetical protein
MGNSMSGFVLAGDSSGSITLQATSVAGTNTITLPASTGTAALTSDITTAINNNVIGVGQTWQNVVASRALATNYTNTTGKPIMVFVHCRSNTANGIGVQITVDGVIAADGRDDASGYGPSLTTIVPAGSVYRADIVLYSGSLINWSELR